VAGVPAPHLLTALRTDGVNLEFMAGLFRLARDAGAVEAVEDASASAWFDATAPRWCGRPSGSRGWRRRRKWYAGLREAVSVVEETSRVVGLSRLVEQVLGSGRSTRAVLQERAQNAAGMNEHNWPYLAWASAAGAALRDTRPS
jgi:hypothetical protein